MELSLVNSPKLQEYLKSFYGLYDGVRLVFMFPNGYGASVIRHSHSYGGKHGLWELAVIDKDENLCYDTEITDDVIGYLTEDTVVDHLEQIFKLKKFENSNK